MTKFLLKNMGNSEIRKRKRRQLHDKYDHDNHVYGTGSAHYTRAYIETGHKESFLPFFPSLLHSPILHLPFVSPFLFAHFHFYARHYFLSLPSCFLLFISFPFFHFFFICFVRASLLEPPLSLSRLSSIVHPRLAFDRLYRSLHGFRPLSSLLLPLAYSHPPPIASHVPSRSLPHFSSVRSRSLVNPKQQVPALLAALRVHLLNRFLSLVLLAGRSIGHVARFGRGFHFQKNPDRTIPLGSWVKHRILDCIFRRDSRSSIRISLFQPVFVPSILSRINK